MDATLKKQVQAVCKLRQDSEKTYNEVKKQLSEDTSWTPMNETDQEQDGECTPGRVPGFKLNRLLNQIAVSRVERTTQGHFLNGEDSRYDYSLFERSVQAGKTVSFELKGREGLQCFVLVPYSKNTGVISATIEVKDGEKVVFSDSGDHVLLAGINCPQGKTLILSVTGIKDQSFVILNHNSRKP